MKTKAEILAECAEKIATAEKLAAIAGELATAEKLSAISAELAKDPALPPVDRLHEFECYGDATAIVKADTLPDALVLAERLNPEGLYRVLDGCLSIRPWSEKLEKLPLVDNEAHGVRPVGPWYYKVDGIYGQREEKTLHCYIKRGGYTVHVEIQVQTDPDTFRQFERSFNRRGEVSRRSCHLVNKSGNFLTVHTMWSSPEHPNAYLMY